MPDDIFLVVIEKKTNVVFTLSINSIQQLVKRAVNQLENHKGLFNGEGFVVISHCQNRV